MKMRRIPGSITKRLISRIVNSSPIKITKNYQYGLGLNRGLVVHSLSLLLIATVLITLYLGSSASASFSDDFNRSNNATVGNGWVETEGTGAISINNNKLFFEQTDDLANRPMIEKSFTSYSSGTLEWIYTMDWNNNGEGTLAMFMQIGDNGSWVDPATNQHTGVAASLRWSGLGCSGSSECLAYRNNSPAYVDIQTLNTATTIKVTLDLDNDTFNIDVGNNGSNEVSAQGFTNGAQNINAIRFFTDGLNDNNVLGRTFDDVSVQVVPEPGSNPILSQTGYIWENDDSNLADNNSQLGAGGTALVGVNAGTRLALRTQIKNTGGAITPTDELGLFYDRGDGIWTRVGQSQSLNTSSGTGCADNKWTCVSVDTAGDVGEDTAIAFDNSGLPWVVYEDDTNGDLKIARYVGSGGTGCASSAWSCTTVDAGGTVGNYTSIAMDEAGKPWVAYHKNTGDVLKIAQYVGSGGTGCASSAWSCSVVDDTDGNGKYTSIAFDQNHQPWISYRSDDSTSLRVARYVSSGGSGCGTNLAWNCVNVDTLNNVGKDTSIAFDLSGKAWVSYREVTTRTIRIASYVGSGGNCSSSEWNCEEIDNKASNHFSARSAALAISSSGEPWISYHNDTGGSLDLRIAKLVGGGSGSGCTNSNWTCENVDTTGDVGEYNTIAFDPGGSAWISYTDDTNGDLKIARYVSTSGNGCATTAWECTTVDSASSVGTRNSIAFDNNGRPWISYRDAGTNLDLKIAYIDDRGGEIQIASSELQSQGDSLNESHADMTSISDASNRDDADCIGGGTWNNGALIESASAKTLNVSDGTGTAQCTELTWIIDTSQSQAETTYRFMVAVRDDISKNWWRGPASITSFPTLSIGSTAASTVMAAKDASHAISQTTCTGADESDWRCEALHSSDIGVSTEHGLAISPDGTPWIVEARRTLSPSSYLQVAKYVGEGNGDCTDNDAWECTVIETRLTALNYYQPSIGFDLAGNPWISYADNTGGTNYDLKAAQYVGSGGNCSGSSEWQCETVLTLGTSSNQALAIDHTGIPWISYDSENGTEGLGVARYVGSGGNGCTSSAWECELIEVGVDTTDANQLIFDHNNIPWIAYKHTATNDLKVARLVGDGGTGCNIASWDCKTIEATGDIGSFPSIAIAPDNTPWIAYRDTTNFYLKIAEFVGASGGSGCDTSTDWNCSNIQTNGQYGSNHISLAFDSLGRPWVATYNSSTGVEALVVARYIGVSGSCSNSAWDCKEVEEHGDDIGKYANLAFDNTGNPWISYLNDTNDNLRIAHLVSPRTPPNINFVNRYDGRSAFSGMGTFRMTDGRSPQTDSLGNCVSNYSSNGYCGLYHADGNLEHLNSGSNARPIYTYAMKSDVNTTAPFTRVHFQTDASPATSRVDFEVYRFGTTNGWETISSRTTAGCNTTNCVLEGTPSGTASEYFHQVGSEYWVYVRISQAPLTATTINFGIDAFSVILQRDWLRHGQTIDEYRSGRSLFEW